MDSAANQKGINQSCGEISKTCTDDFLDLEMHVDRSSLNIVWLHSQNPF